MSLRTAVSSAINRAVASAGARRKLSSVAMQQPAFVPKVYQTNFKKDFLSDPSTYPIIAILTFICTFVAGGTLHNGYKFKDIRIRPAHKHTELQTWGEDHYTPVTRSLAHIPMLFHSHDWQKVRQGEGLGVSHGDFVRRSTDYNKEHDEGVSD